MIIGSSITICPRSYSHHSFQPVFNNNHQVSPKTPWDLEETYFFRQKKTTHSTMDHGSLRWPPPNATFPPRNKAPTMAISRTMVGGDHLMRKSLVTTWTPRRISWDPPNNEGVDIGRLDFWDPKPLRMYSRVNLYLQTNFEIPWFLGWDPNYYTLDFLGLGIPTILKTFKKASRQSGLKVYARYIWGYLKSLCLVDRTSMIYRYIHTTGMSCWYLANGL